METVMSTCYYLIKKVPAADLLDGRLEEFGVSWGTSEDTSSEKHEAFKWLTDGHNYLSLSINDDGFIGTLERRGANAPGKILNAIAEAFDTDIVSEYEPQFWGFDTQEGWDAWWEQRSRESEEEFDVELGCARVAVGRPYPDNRRSRTSRDPTRARWLRSLRG
jgi:hypothetical protein